MEIENAKNLKLEVPPDDTTLTPWDVVTRVKWRRIGITQHLVDELLGFV
jgi:hypothetical protein